MERKFFLYIGGIVCFAFIGLLFFIAPEPTVTGRVSFDVSLKYMDGEKILGDLKFHIKEGELVPKDSLVLIDYAGQSKSFLLSELVFDRPIKGNFYAEGTKLTGDGLGYGVKGSKIVYPSIGFTLKISDSNVPSSSAGISSKNSQPKSNAPVSSSGSGGGPSYSPAPSPSEPAPSAPISESESSPASSDDASGPGLTGAIVNENSRQIKGTTAYGVVFEYALESGQTAQLVKGSVTTDGKSLPDNSVSVELKNGKVIVSTNYFVSEQKFGKDFLGDYALALSINVELLDLYAKEGVLNIKLVHGNTVIASHSRLVSVTALPAEKTINLLKEIQTIRILPDGEFVLNLSQYFEGADSYAIEIPNIATVIRNNEIVFRPEAGFKGARRARLVAYAGENKLESNEFAILVSSGAVTIKTSKDRIEVGKPVRWVKNVKFDSPDNMVVDIPDGATDISVTKMTEAPSESVFESIGSGALTGQVSIELDINKRAGFMQWVRRIANRLSGRITGNALEDVGVDSALNDITLLPDSLGYAIEYYTPSPEAFEEETENGKRVTISGPDDILYEDVVASATLDESLEILDASRVQLYWLTAEPVVSGELKDVDEVPKHEVVEELSEVAQIVKSDESADENVLSPVSSSESVVSTTSELRQLKHYAVPFNAYDLDGNGYLDYIEWVVPHLSNQTYEIILVVRAEHLDENYTFISDIYPEVKALDGNWSETIFSGHYARVTFEINLTSDRDITIYPRTIAGTPQIEVYEYNRTKMLAKFDNLIDNSYNKVYLTNLTHSQDVFDLRITGGDVQFDYIVDPAVDVTPPNIDFVSPTPADASTQAATAIYVNVSSSDASQHYTFADFDRSLLLWMRMDDTNASGDPTDLSSWGNNGSKQGNAVQNSSGYFNSSFGFDGNGDYINILYLPNFVATQNYTYSAWVNLNNNGSNTIVAQAGIAADSGRGFSFEINSTNFLTFTRYPSFGTRDVVVKSSDALNLNQWYFVTATYVAGNVSLYTNGALKGNNASSGFVNYTGFGIEAVGASSEYSTTAGSYINGSIDEVLIFNRSLAQAEISALYNASANKYFNNFTNLAAGAHTFTSYAVDTAGNKNQTEQRTVTIDTTAPVANLIAPANGSTATTATHSFNATFSDNNALSNATFYLWNSTLSLINTTTNSLSGTSGSVNLTVVLPAYGGLFTWNYLVMDNATNSAFNATNFTLTYKADSASPAIDYATPTETDKAYLSRNYILVNVSASDANLQAIVVRLYNSSRAQINSSTASSSPSYVNFSGLADGTYYFNATANDTFGNSNATATREVTIDAAKPLISYGAVTENSGEALANASLFANITLTETNFANITFSLYNGSGVFNRTNFEAQTLTFNWTSVPAGTYTYEVNATDLANNKNGTGSRAITLVGSCLASCAEGSACALTNTNCYLHSGMCTGNLCDFVNLTLQNSTIYTLYNSSNDANSLAINLSSNSSASVRFPSTSSFIFWGKNGTSLAGGSRGGYAGVLNITTLGLFNRTNSRFFGMGGYSTLAGAGGNGGILQLNYHGLIGTTSSWTTSFVAGNSTNNTRGSAGASTLIKDGVCPLDAEITNNGIIDFDDILSITEELYGVSSTNSSFVAGYDINCDGILNVIDLSRIGFQFGRR